MKAKNNEVLINENQEDLNQIDQLNKDIYRVRNTQLCMVLL